MISIVQGLCKTRELREMQKLY
ncbi:hypothetical protein KsCSTR_38040 [Candidatus Kuenenia stuttgartiensis]|uniref:Uncharacterized protein n=1 Tax=Kuenenia stuttgartiensis TaxID=174633 RepID=A0A6G7GV38_KUEST|nr:hypothetical protein KsCSTR_38040 [Candidatus Kuenenia stuttgartiensis]